MDVRYPPATSTISKQTVKKGMPNKESRPSPSESATAFPVGATATGNDRRRYVVSADKRGVHRWKPVATMTARKPSLKNQPKEKKQTEEPVDEECARNLRRYEKTNLAGNGFHVMQGQHSTGTFGTEYIDGNLITPGYKWKAMPRWLVAMMCPLSVDERALRSRGAVSVDDWYVMAERLCLTIADVVTLPRGKKLPLLMLDRNWGDLALDNAVNTRGQAFSPARFFRRNKAIYSQTRDFRNVPSPRLLAGTMHMQGVDTQTDWEFEVEYKPGFWYPLIAGYLPSHDAQRLFGKMAKRDTHWTELDPSTRVGFRGPLIRWSDVVRLPSVYWT